ncbi:MAG: hypothetical protein RI897_1974 [Verrucomicrobiota bacterium]
MSDDDCQCAEFAVDALDGFEDDDTGADVEGAGGFIAEEDFGAFSDGAGDGDALLFTAGELGGEVVEPGAEVDHVEGVFRGERMVGDFGDQADIFAGGEAGDEVIELEHKADRIASEAGECVFVGL